MMLFYWKSVFCSVVEDIKKTREPLHQLEAVYLIQPCKESIDCLMQDFVTNISAKYKCAHVYFTESKATNATISLHYLCIPVLRGGI